MRKYDVLFRVDAGPGIGLGHLRRCYALASALMDVGVRKIGFLTRRADLIKPWIDSRFGIEVIGKRPLKSEIKKCSSILKRLRPKLLIVDHYDYVPSHILELKKYSEFIACIDDNADWSSYPVDAIINHNVYASQLKYEHNGKVKKFLGNKYALVVPEIAKKRQQVKIKKGQESVYITLGGNTKVNTLHSILNSLDNVKPAIKNLKIYLAGSKLKKSDFKSHCGKISAVSSRDVAAVMKKATFAISAGGITSYELACLGIPALLLVKTDNQTRLAKAMSKRNVALNLGKVQELKAHDLTRKISRLVKNIKKRQDMYRNGRKFIDGAGAFRLARKVKDAYLK